MRSLPRLPLLALVAGMGLGLAPGIDVGGTFDAAAKASSNPIVIELGKHRFGRTREPQAVVAHAAPGDGLAEVGMACPPEGECSMPPSFDVAADGTVWVTDAVNRRLLAWAQARPDRPSRTIPLDFLPADLALAADGTIYVTGLRPGIDKSMQLFAIDTKGREAWRSAMPTEEFSFNSHIRMGPDGILYGAFYGSDGSRSWAPAIDDDGRPLVPAEQLRLAKPAQPLAGGRRLAVTGEMEPATMRRRNGRSCSAGSRARRSGPGGSSPRTTSGCPSRRSR